MKDNQRKIIFGWSAKCGCSHVKMLFRYLVLGDMNFNLRHQNSYNGIGYYDNSYLIILFVRNPLIRLVSGFIEKYGYNNTTVGPFCQKWNHSIPLNFTNFVAELIKNSRLIDQHHFTPQLSEKWEDRIMHHKNLIVYDINNIDYSFLENIYQKKIPSNILNYRGYFRTHHKKIILDKPEKEVEVFNLPLVEYYPNSYPTESYYSNEILEKVVRFYKKDFKFFGKKGLYLK